MERPDDDLRLRREAAAAGLRRSRAVSTDAVARRRRQLWLLVALTFAGGTAAAALLTTAAVRDGQRVPPQTLAGVMALVAGFALYCVEKEVHLRRVERLLADEREFSARVSARVDDLGALLRAGKAVNSALDLTEVLDTVLETTLGMFDGASGSIMLLDDGEALTVASSRGNAGAVGARSRLGDGIAGHVARTREPVLVNGPADAESYPGYRPRRRHAGSAMCVPLLHRDVLVGVLNVTAAGTHTFTPEDLELLSLFAEHAASGVTHARVHAEERARIDEMVRLEQMKTDFITGVSHDLRTPLTSIVGCTAMARRPDLTPEQRDELLVIAEAQAQKLSAMVERMLMSAELGVDPNPASIAPFDLAGTVREVAARHLAAGHAVHVSVEARLPYALGDRDRLAQALDLLLENAFRHGAPPVEIGVRATGARVAVSVRDRGRGVPEADRERVFERFVRLDASRGTPGVGLGLSIVRGLVATMGATVTATDRDGGGAAFTVELVTSGAVAGPVPEQPVPLRLVAG